ncbi:MAG: hypothetical protein IPP83_00315 [Flavobacteriales bacterium]|nr:hypothetical protein [Flavobacteriales bacterium]
MQQDESCGLSIPMEEFASAKKLAPAAIGALCDTARGIIDKGGAVCILNAGGEIVKRIMTLSELEVLCSEYKHP